MHSLSAAMSLSVEVLARLQAPSGPEAVYKHLSPTQPQCFRIRNRRVRSHTDLATYLTPELINSVCVGLFAGLSLEGTVLIERKDANREFYGSAIPVRDILGGRVPPPEVASKLYEIIEAAEGLDETGLPESAYVPSSTGGHLEVKHDQHMVFDADDH